MDGPKSSQGSQNSTHPEACACAHMRVLSAAGGIWTECSLTSTTWSAACERLSVTTWSSIHTKPVLVDSCLSWRSQDNGDGRAHGVLQRSGWFCSHVSPNVWRNSCPFEDAEAEASIQYSHRHTCQVFSYTLRRRGRGVEKFCVRGSSNPPLLPGRKNLPFSAFR